MFTRWCRSFGFAAAGLTWLVFAAASLGASAAQDASWTENVTTDAVREWADAYFTDALDKEDIQGGAIAVVKDGDVLFQQGYGYADVVRGVKADASTVFRSASVNKLFTAISILQLVERGLIDLDDEINEHISSAKIATPMGRTTIRHLITHTAGFDEGFRATFVAEPRLEKSNAAYLQQYPRIQVRPPGETITYSNFGMGLAGMVIQDVSGMTYGDYVRQNVFQPLGMDGVTVEFPGKLREDRAREHMMQDGVAVPRPFYYKAPFYLSSGGFYFSANDMALFMNAVLSRSGQLLAPDSWEAALTLQKRSGEGLGGGIGYGFWIYEPEKDAQGQIREPGRASIAGHGGDTSGFKTRVYLFPNERIGLFYALVDSSYGVLQGSSNYEDSVISTSFADTFRGFSRAPDYNAADGPELEAFTGAFLTNRRSFAGPEYFLGSLFTRPAHVTLKEGRLFWNDEPMRRIGERSFALARESGPEQVIGFRDDLQVVYTSVSSSLNRISPLHPANYLLWVFLAGVLLALSIAVTALIRGVKHFARVDGLLCGIAALIILVFFTPVIGFLLGAHPRAESLHYPVQSGLAWLCLFGTAAAAYLLYQRFSAAKSEAHDDSGVFLKSRLASLSGAAVVVVLFVAYDVIRL
ncbi:MAG: serine hydrolase domain-containing protein [Pseudomonadota bacterium]